MRSPAVRIARRTPAIMLPMVSIENDFPGMKPFISLAEEISLIKVNPETRQNGTRNSKVSIMLIRKEGVSPDSRKSRDRSIRRSVETKGLTEKIRLIFRISLRFDLPARAAPAAEAISQDPRNTPVISSYPPEIFIISLISKT